MPETGITWNAEAFLRRLAATSRPQLDRSVAQALDDTGRVGTARAGQLIQRRTGLRGGISWKARGWSLIIRSSRAPNPLDSFPVSQTAAGVRINVWGKSQTLRGAFTTSKGVYRRRGHARLPIRRLWGPTVWGTFKSAGVQNIVAAHMKNALKAALVRRIGAAQRR